MRKFFVIGAVLAAVQGAAVAGLLYAAYQFALYQGWVR